MLVGTSMLTYENFAFNMGVYHVHAILLISSTVNDSFSIGRLLKYYKKDPLVYLGMGLHGVFAKV